MRGSVYERLRWTFKLYDLNGDGCISRNELSEIVQAIHELMGRRPHQPEDDRKCRDQVRLECDFTKITWIEKLKRKCITGRQGIS